ncbi:ubiquitin carboxyl-terminal hydrolase 20 isoform X2 [Medicago truncatula]|uniref:ubiquitin carboxyl-terminal hydrolase 20 isoform X2 n=1 Tax=Medicago truncatula TaxID=3880 RepID=UPI000D2F2CDF|nr:ubiquitin carboxyl-terminal hydrolase 20 isoform X2 [Medicago truncatula]
MPSLPSSPELIPSEPKPNEPNPNPIPETEPNPNAPPSHPQTTSNKPPPTVTDALGGDLATGLSTVHGASSEMLGGDLAPTGLSTAHGASSEMLGGDFATGLSTVHGASSDMLGGDLATGLSIVHCASSDMIGGNPRLSTAYGEMTNALGRDIAAHGALFKSVGAGIRNSGNTSFLSAILQCFTHTVPMFRGLRSCTHASPCDVKSFCFICAFRNHFDNALEPSGVPVVPREITENLHSLIAGYVRGKQEEDAHEFMQSALKELQKSFPVGEENLIDQVFGGRLVDTFRCCCCRGYSSATFVPFKDMSLEIELAASIPHALKSITRVEQLAGKFRCSNCNQEVVLNYEVYAVVMHRGPSPNSGHYFCFVRSAPDKWYLMDDDKVSSVSEEEALNHRAADHKAYILFYAKEGTPWFSTIVEKDDNDSTADPNEEDHDNNGAEDDNDSTDASYSWLRKMGERRAREEYEPCECSIM